MVLSPVDGVEQVIPANAVLLLVIRMTIGRRVTENDKVEVIDLAEHSERGNAQVPIPLSVRLQIPLRCLAAFATVAAEK